MAGDNLFKDFQVDFGKADDPKLNPADRHVLENVRDVVLYGQRDDDLPKLPRRAHGHRARSTAICPSSSPASTATTTGAADQGHKTYEVHSERCEY